MTDSTDEEQSAEVASLAAALLERFGIDCQEYAPGSFRSRIVRHARAEGLPDIPAYATRILIDPALLGRLMLSFAGPAGPMFHRPSFYAAVRRLVVPVLRTYPFANVWCAGCSTGEEAYAMAILLEEEGIGERTRLYATDVNEVALGRAREGVYTADALSEADYLAGGGRRSLGEYFSLHGDRAAARPWLRGRITFAEHSLLWDASFNEFQLILCGRVLSDFDEASRRRVAALLDESLCVFGILSTSSAEPPQSWLPGTPFEELDAAERLYRKVG